MRLEIRRAALLRRVPWLAPLLQRLPRTMLERQATRYLNAAIHGG